MILLLLSHFGLNNLTAALMAQLYSKNTYEYSNVLNDTSLSPSRETRDVTREYGYIDCPLITA